MQEKCTPMGACSPIPAARRSLEREEELLKRFEEASRAYYVLAEAGMPERLEKAGRLMDEAAEGLRRGPRS